MDLGRKFHLIFQMTATTISGHNTRIETKVNSYNTHNKSCQLHRYTSIHMRKFSWQWQRAWHTQARSTKWLPNGEQPKSINFPKTIDWLWRRHRSSNDAV